MLCQEVTQFERAVIRNAFYTDVHLHRCIPSIVLYSTLVEMRRYKIRCRCGPYVSKSNELLRLTRQIPHITSPRTTDKEWDGTEFGDSPFAEGWEICCAIFEIIKTCHAVPHDDEGFIRTSDINKLGTFFPTKTMEVKDRPDHSAASETLSGPWDDCDNNTSDDDLPSLE